MSEVKRLACICAIPEIHLEGLGVLPAGLKVKRHAPLPTTSQTTETSASIPSSDDSDDSSHSSEEGVSEAHLKSYNSADSINQYMREEIETYEAYIGEVLGFDLRPGQALGVTATKAGSVDDMIRGILGEGSVTSSTPGVQQLRTSLTPLAGRVNPSRNHTKERCQPAVFLIRLAKFIKLVEQMAKLHREKLVDALFLFTGHGREADGALLMPDHKNLPPATFYSLTKEQLGTVHNVRLTIIIDGCHSGWWIKTFRETEWPKDFRIAVQSAVNCEEEAFTGKFSSVFCDRADSPEIPWFQHPRYAMTASYAADPHLPVRFIGKDLSVDDNLDDEI
ncbi:hypothetical protein DFS34DRAFT_327757 [Phlyctochytrium arcticum]|nr:hypothetical protein DFS34DRAFT_327757 [Phlyctochytrium arcticum]